MEYKLKKKKCSCEYFGNFQYFTQKLKNYVGFVKFFMG